jgi:hypothetical protein
MNAAPSVAVIYRVIDRASILNEQLISHASRVTKPTRRRQLQY